MMARYCDRPPLTRRQQETPWGEDGAGAVGRLIERCTRLEDRLHQQDRTARQLRDALASERRHNTVLRARLAIQRTRKRRRADPGQLALPLG